MPEKKLDTGVNLLKAVLRSEPRGEDGQDYLRRSKAAVS